MINDNGEMLLVKEMGRDRWELPGGGIEHGESVKEGLARELFEELGYQGSFEYELLVIDDPRVLESRRITQITVVMLVFPESVAFGLGTDGDKVRYMDPQEFESANEGIEQDIYRYSRLALTRLR